MNYTATDFFQMLITELELDTSPFYDRRNGIICVLKSLKFYYENMERLTLETKIKFLKNFNLSASNLIQNMDTDGIGIDEIIAESLKKFAFRITPDSLQR